MATFVREFMICSTYRMRASAVLVAGFACLLASLATSSKSIAADSPVVREFLERHCRDCHHGAEAEAGFDLDKLGLDPADPTAEKHWVRVFDRVHEGEMPPKDAERPAGAERDKFVAALGDELRTARAARDAATGRVRARRLTRREVERSLHAVLGVDIPLAELLPEESRSGGGFTTTAEGQAISHFHLEAHLAAVDRALDEAFRRVLKPEPPEQREFDARGVARTNPNRRCREPEMRRGQAVTWSSGLTFYGRLPATTARRDGWYRFAVTVSALKPPESGGVWCTVNTGLCTSSAPLLIPVTTFEATERPRTIEFEAWLPKGHMLEIRPGDVTLKKARFQGGQVGVGEGEPQDVPGIAIDGLTMRQVHRGGDDDDVRALLIGDLPVKWSKGGGRYVATKAPQADLEKLMRAMAERAFRRPVDDAELAKYVKIAATAYVQLDDFDEALRVGYRALLCSPRFLYLTESPGKLDDFAVASRLSYFLTGAPPDAQLLKLAAAGTLRDEQTLHDQTDRLLGGDGVKRFVADFAAEWLDLDQIDFTEPDGKLYPKFDAIVKQAMLTETHAYLEEMLRDDLGVARLIDADYTYLNGRLATYYGVQGVAGDELRRVSLTPETHRGGLLTHGAILKVTANGSNTSPVVRGVWISERILGTPIPPPPSAVPAIEPDIRGATTIREQLLKHRAQESCAVCHRKIDPPGFALENFDPAGQWRDRYLAFVGRKKTTGPKIDAGYVTADGREFADFVEFRELVAAEPRKPAANLVEKLLAYGTGAPISFADREVVEHIVNDAAATQYGFRSLVKAVVTSPVFLSK